MYNITRLIAYIAIALTTVSFPLRIEGLCGTLDSLRYEFIEKHTVSIINEHSGNGVIVKLNNTIHVLTCSHLANPHNSKNVGSSIAYRYNWNKDGKKNSFTESKCSVHKENSLKDWSLLSVLTNKPKKIELEPCSDIHFGKIPNGELLMVGYLGQNGIKKSRVIINKLPYDYSDSTFMEKTTNKKIIVSYKAAIVTLSDITLPGPYPQNCIGLSGSPLVLFNETGEMNKQIGCLFGILTIASPPPPEDAAGKKQLPNFVALLVSEIEP